MTKPLTPLQKWARRIKIDPATGCHLWMRFLNPLGYGQTRVGGRAGKNILAHRLAWQMFCGPIPEGLKVLHECDNPRCVNPAHLFLGTHADNMADMVKKGRHRVGALPRGAAHPRAQAKLTALDISAIRTDTRKQREIAATYGVHQSNISRLKRGSSFAHIIG